MKISVRDMILVALFAALMVVGAYIKILFPVVPMSFQAFFCALAGILLGSKLGALSQIIYVLIGLAGVPVFTQGGGPAYIFKSSFGFILGFIAAAYVIGLIAEKLKKVNLKNSLVAVMSGLAILNLIGLPYMYMIIKFYMNKPTTTMWYVISVGFLPFILKDIIMYIVVAVIATKVVPIVRMSGVSAR